MCIISNITHRHIKKLLHEMQQLFSRNHLSNVCFHSPSVKEVVSDRDKNRNVMKAPSGIPVHTLRSTQRPVTVRSHRYRRMGCAVGTDAPPPGQPPPRSRRHFLLWVLCEILTTHLKLPIGEVILTENGLCSSSSGIYTGVIVDHWRWSEVIIHFDLGTRSLTYTGCYTLDNLRILITGRRRKVLAVPLRCASAGITFDVVPELNAVILITDASSGFNSLATTRCIERMNSEAATTGSTVWCGSAPWPPLPFT